MLSALEHVHGQSSANGLRAGFKALHPAVVSVADFPKIVPALPVLTEDSRALVVRIRLDTNRTNHLLQQRNWLEAGFAVLPQQPELELPCPFHFDGGGLGAGHERELHRFIGDLLLHGEPFNLPIVVVQNYVPLDHHDRGGFVFATPPVPPAEVKSGENDESAHDPNDDLLHGLWSFARRAVRIPLWGKLFRDSKMPKSKIDISLPLIYPMSFKGSAANHCSLRQGYFLPYFNNFVKSLCVEIWKSNLICLNNHIFLYCIRKTRLLRCRKFKDKIMEFREIHAKVVKNAEKYGKNYNIEISEDFALLKLYEEVGEFAQAVLIHRKMSRPEKHMHQDLSKKEVAKELADVVGLAMLNAHLLGIDLEDAMFEKWINRLEN